MTTTEATLTAYRNALGAAYVVVDLDALRAAETATFPTEQRILAIARPASAGEVQECVRIAKSHGTPLYPISRGTNWGYGSRVPVATGSILLDLSRMDRIDEFDETLGHFTVEPGVTFRRAFQFLRQRRSRLLLSAIGGSPDSSLIGNVLDRGIGKGPYGDRFAHVCNLEVVTGSGALIHTGFGRFPGAKAAPLHRWGLGPSLDGLFTQSSFGIVTRMTQWLMPCPEHFQILFYQVENEDDVPAVVDALRQLVMSGALRPTLTLYNDYRVMASTTLYPFERAGGRTPLSADLRAALRSELDGGKGGGVWGGDVAIYSPDVEHGRATRRLVERKLAGKVSRLEAVEADAVEMEALLDDAASMKAPASLRQGLLLNFLGIPNDDAIRSVYWRKPDLPAGHFDPDRDRCGLVWCAPVVPFVGSDVARVLRVMDACMREHGFEPGLTVQCMTERVVYVVASISYDRDVADDDARALTCYHQMVESLARQGYPPYRLSIASMVGTGSEALRSRDASPDVLEALRSAMDPGHILAPGRYRVD
jgi:4-cresol dehydrogenase (hydroxylating) flavoprotein subunit